MVDTSGQAEIRGIDIDKLAKGFADEENVFKRICLITPTSAREIRWYQKTSGFLSGTTTTGMTSELGQTSHLGLPSVIEQSWTRQTSYVKKFIHTSPLISYEDIKDSDVDVLATNVRDIVRAVERLVDKRIYDVVSTDMDNTTPSTAAWDASSGQDIIKDLMVAKRKIRVAGYNPEGAYLLLSPKDHESMLTWLISDKGSSIPSFASQKVETGVVMEVLGLRVLVSNNVDADEAMVVVPQRAMTWKSFMPISAVRIDDPGLGVKIRAWEEGEAIMTDTYAASKITNTQA